MKKASFQPSVLPYFSTNSLLFIKDNLLGNSANTFCQAALNTAIRNIVCKAALIYKEVVYARLHICTRTILVALIAGYQIDILLTRNSKAVADRRDNHIPKLLGNQL